MQRAGCGASAARCRRAVQSAFERRLPVCLSQGRAARRSARGLASSTSATRRRRVSVCCSARTARAGAPPHINRMRTRAAAAMALAVLAHMKRADPEAAAVLRWLTRGWCSGSFPLARTCTCRTFECGAGGECGPARCSARAVPLDDTLPHPSQPLRRPPPSATTVGKRRRQTPSATTVGHRRFVQKAQRSSERRRTAHRLERQRLELGERSWAAGDVRL